MQKLFPIPLLLGIPLVLGWTWGQSEEVSKTYPLPSGTVSLPACDSKEAKQLVLQTMQDAMKGGLVTVTFGIEDVTTLSSQANRHECTASIEARQSRSMGGKRLHDTPFLLKYSIDVPEPNDAGVFRFTVAQ